MEQKSIKSNEKGLLEIVYIAVYLGIAVAAGSIVLFITSRVVAITGTPTNSHLSNASENLMNTADTGYSFLPIVAVAAIGAIANFLNSLEKLVLKADLATYSV